MFTQSKLTDFFARLAVGLALGLLAGLLISEISYLLLPEKQAAQRAPQQIDLLIPEGTAERIERGEFTSILPDEMIFVEGDVLQVKNEDSVAHQLGPLFVPPGVSSRLALDMANSYSYACSFETDQYVGLDVVPRTTLSVRLQGVMAIGLPSGMMLLVYSYLIPNESVLGLRRRIAGRRSAGQHAAGGQSAASKDAP